MSKSKSGWMKRIGLLLLLLVVLTTSAAAGTVGYESYSYNYGTGDAVAAVSPHPYLPSQTVDLRELYGVKTLTDFCRDNRGNWYVVDSGTNRLLILDSDFSLLNIVESFGEGDAFSAPEGVCVLPNGNVCVADTGNHRLVVLTAEGVLTATFTAEGQQGVRSEFLPTRIGAGGEGQLYVVSENDYTGVLELDENGRFLGYLGSTEVTFNWIDWLWKQIMTEVQKDKLIQFVPVEYNSLAVDEDGFIFAVSASETETKPVRRLNPSGVDVLSHNGYTTAIDGDVGVRSAFVDICPGVDGSYHILDNRKGRIFTYSEDGYLLYVFGGLGSQNGCTQQPVALESDERHLYVLDAGTGCLQIYELTTYAERMLQGLHEYNAGRYEESMAIWQQVLIENSNCDLAYAQIGRSLLRLDRYEEAMSYFRLGNLRGDRVVLDGGYNKAFTQYRRRFLMDWWWALLLGGGAVIAAWVLFRRWWRCSSVKGVVAVRESVFGVQWRFSKRLLFHPFDGFWCMKRENQGSLPYALGLVGLWLLTNVLTKQATGFLFTGNALSTVDLMAEIRNLLIIFVLFTVGNWSVTTLMGGEGRYRDIVMLFGYASLPNSLIGLPLCFVTNVLTYAEAAYVSILQTVAVGWFLFLLFFGLMTIHQYSVGKTVWTVVLTIVAMAILIFVAMVFMELLAGMTGFVSAVFQEFMTRM